MMRRGAAFAADALAALALLGVIAATLATGAWFQRMANRADQRAAEQDEAVRLAQSLRDGRPTEIPAGWTASQTERDGLRMTVLGGPLGTRLTVLRP